MLELNLNMYHGVALGAVLFWLGNRITDRVGFLNRYCIPAPLVGGLCFAVLNTLLYSLDLAVIRFDDTLQTVFMIMFFTTVGFTVSIPALIKGGKSVALCLILATIMIPLQNGLGGGIMALMDRSPLFGIACGSVALVGGPGTAAAYGPDLVAAGAVGGDVVAIAAATFGLVAGSLVGGPAARRLIKKYDLECKLTPTGGGENEGAGAEAERFTTESPRMIKGFMMLLLAVGVGSWVSTLLTDITGMSFPAYIGAMLVAVVIRNVVDALGGEYPEREIETMGNMFLSIFLAMALAGLALWQLIDLALPMIVCLLLQVVMIYLFSYCVVFRVMGRDYDAAVMTAGFIGFSMGATSNAMANMQVITKKYGPSPVAYFAIPMVGGMFIDFVNAFLTTMNIGLWAIG